MTTKQLILKDLESLQDDQLKLVHGMIRDIKKNSKNNKKLLLFDQVKKIKIKGPKDFAKNLDSYISGEKNLE